MSTDEQKRADLNTIRSLRRLAQSTFDSECYNLAIYFLTDEPMNDTVDAERYRHALATHIQSEVESWISFERKMFEERGGSPNDLGRTK